MVKIYNIETKVTWAKTKEELIFCLCVVGQEKVQDKTVSLCFEKYEDKRIQILKNLKEYKMYY